MMAGNIRHATVRRRPVSTVTAACGGVGIGIIAAVTTIVLLAVLT